MKQKWIEADYRYPILIQSNVIDNYVIEGDITMKIALIVHDIVGLYGQLHVSDSSEAIFEKCSQCTYRQKWYIIGFVLSPWVFIDYKKLNRMAHQVACRSLFPSHLSYTNQNHKGSSTLEYNISYKFSKFYVKWFLRNGS